MEVAELKMLRFSLGVTRMDKIRNEYIRGTAQVGKFGEKTREARLRWYGHLRRKDDGYIGRRMLKIKIKSNQVLFSHTYNLQYVIIIIII